MSQRVHKNATNDIMDYCVLGTPFPLSK